MGTNSKYHRYREAGQEANVNNVAAFGEPQYSLFTSTKVFTLHHKILITDEQENPKYRAQTKFFTLHDTTRIYDAYDNEVALIRKKFFSFHERHYITMADGTQFELSNRFWQFIRDDSDIEGLGWTLKGNITALNFELYDQNGEMIANIAQKMFSLHDKYCIDIYKPEHEKKVIAILITLQHMIRDREKRNNSSSSHSSSSNY